MYENVCRFYKRKDLIIMKTTIAFRNNEIAAINDLLGTYGSEKRIKQVNGSAHGITFSGVFDSEHNYVLSVEVPASMVLGLCQIGINHAKAVKGLVKALSGIKDTIEYLARNISRDVRDLFREYEKDE